MKSWSIAIVLLLSLVLIGSLSCNPAGAEEPKTLQQSVVQDDLTVSVSGSGNIEVANEIKLAFGVAGKIDKIYFDEGDNVSEGTVLARLDTDALELALTQAQVARNKAEVTLNEAQIAQTKAQAAITKAQLAKQTAEYELKEAQDLYAEPEIHKARVTVSDAKSYLEYAEWTLTQASITSDVIRWTNEVSIAREKLRAAEVRVNEMLAVPDTEEIAIKRLQLEVAQQSLELAKQSVELDRQSLEIAGQSLKLDEQSLELAWKQLDEATITAPFDGLVARVTVDEGDTVSTATTIIHLIDPTSMELNVEVDEIDIPGVKLGQRAIIEIDALPDLPLEGKVSSISLLPTIATGLVMYDVKIEFDVPEDIGLRTGMSATADIVIAE